MVDENKIFTAVKKRFDDDVTLHRLLQARNDSKVIIGNSMPKYVLPMIQIVKMSNVIETVMTWSEITFNVNIYTREMTDHSFDGDQSESIIQRCNDLIHDQPLTVEDHGIFSVYVEGRSVAIRDMDYPKAFFQGLLCRMFAIKIR